VVVAGCGVRCLLREAFGALTEDYLSNILVIQVNTRYDLVLRPRDSRHHLSSKSGLIWSNAY
jgi:hypothetical protein